MTEAYIYDACRTPRGKGRPDGSLHEVTSVALSAQMLDALATRNGLEGHAVEDVIREKSGLAPVVGILGIPEIGDLQSRQPQQADGHDHHGDQYLDQAGPIHGADVRSHGFSQETISTRLPSPLLFSGMPLPSLSVAMVARVRMTVMARARVSSLLTQMAKVPI